MALASVPTNNQTDYDDASDTDESDYADFLAMVSGAKTTADTTTIKKPAAVTVTQPTSTQPSWDESSADDSDYKNFMSMTRAPSVKAMPVKVVVEVPEMQAQPSWDASSTDNSDFKNFMAVTSAPIAQKVMDVPKMIESKTTEATWDESSTDESDYKNFMAATRTPSTKSVLPSVKPVAVEASPTPVEMSKPVPMERGITKETVNNSEDDDGESSFSSADSDVSSECSAHKKEANAEELTPAQAPMIEAKSLGRGELSSENLVSLQEATQSTAAPAPVVDSAKPVSKPAPTPTANPKSSLKADDTVATIKNRAGIVDASANGDLEEEATRRREFAVAAALAQSSRAIPSRPANKFRDESNVRFDDVPAPPAAAEVPSKSWRALEAKAALKQKLDAKFVLPEDAPLAAKHFDQEKDEKLKEIEAARQSAKGKKPVETLPVDYFTKLGDAEIEAKAKAQWEAAEAVMPAGVAYFTAKAEEDRAKALSAFAEGHDEMSVATKYFNKLAAEKEAEAKRLAKEDPEPMPAAIQHFSMEAYKQNEKKKAEIQAMHDDPPEMAVGTAYFTNMMNERTEEQQAEIKRLKENPPPASAAGQHFEKLEIQRKLEIEAMMNEPAPAAIEYFTSKANEEKAAAEEAMKKATEGGHQKCAATTHFEKQASMKLERMESIRAQVKGKKPDEVLPVDYFTKLGEKETAEKARAQRELAESVVPTGIAYFTAKAEEEKAKKLAEFYEGHDEMSVATKYFNKLALEQEAEKKRIAEEEPEPMPAAIQKFTMEAYAVNAKKKAEIQAMHENPPAMAVGTAYFTNQMRDEAERQQLEIKALRENPPPSSVATAYFAKEESKRQVEIEAMMNEPAPAAIEYFTQKANEEKAAADEAMRKSEAGGNVACAATVHFDKKKEEEERQIKEAREVTKQKMKEPGARPSIDWTNMTKQKAPEVNLFYTVTPGTSMSEQ